MNVAIALDPWDFWRRSLAGEKPETTPGQPHSGFFILKQYFSLPFAAKRVLCDCPVAIWLVGDQWTAVTDDFRNRWIEERLELVDDIFARVARAPITKERYDTMVKTLTEFRANRKLDEGFNDEIF